MDNLKIYKICHHLITYFATLISPKTSQLGPIFRTGGSIIHEFKKLQCVSKCPLLSFVDFVAIQFNVIFFQ